MEQVTDNAIRLAVLFASVQLCRADGNSFYWYSSWYIWFAVTMLMTICCGVLGSYLRRRQIQKDLRNQQSVIVAIQRSEQGQPQVSQSLSPGIFVYPPVVGSTDGAAPYGQAFPNTEASYRPPPYESVVEKQSKIADLPPNYQEAIRAVRRDANPAPTPATSDGDQLNTVSKTVDESSQHSGVVVGTPRPERPNTEGV